MTDQNTEQKIRIEIQSDESSANGGCSVARISRDRKILNYLEPVGTIRVGNELYKKIFELVEGRLYRIVTPHLTSISTVENGKLVDIQVKAWSEVDDAIKSILRGDKTLAEIDPRLKDQVISFFERNNINTEMIDNGGYISEMDIWDTILNELSPRDIIDILVEVNYLHRITVDDEDFYITV